MTLPYAVRPLEPWLGPKTHARRRSPFGVATWGSTLTLMSHELRQVGAQRWVLQIDVEERWINRDGSLHARAVPFSPAVRVSFESRHGHLTYPCDRFDTWQSNVRAIALALEALRKVERYGVAGRGEQYRGWTGISNRPAQMSREQAAEFIAHWAYPSHTSDQLHVAAVALGRDPDAFSAAYRLAAKRVHPDRPGGDADLMARLNVARDLLANGARP